MLGLNPAVLVAMPTIKPGLILGIRHLFRSFFLGLDGTQIAKLAFGLGLKINQRITILIAVADYLASFAGEAISAYRI